MARTGRPPLRLADLRSDRVNIKLTQAEGRVLRALARASGLGISEYLRRLVMAAAKRAAK